MSTTRPKILVVDDIPENLELLIAALTVDFDVQMSTSGAQGLEYVSQAAPDLILLDVMMPEMDGFEVCRRFKTDDRLKDIPIIFLTVLGDAQAESTGLALGAADYITKPINVVTAEHRIRNLLEREALRKESKKLEGVLRESELRYRTVADFTSDWEYWILSDGTLCYVSPSCEQISGYTPAEFYADPQLLNRIVHPEDQNLYARHRHDLGDAAGPDALDFRIRTKDGAIRWIAHVCQPVFDGDGKPNGVRASNRDNTERKRMEEQVRQLAFYDPLTHLPNRRLLNDRLSQTLLASKRSAFYGALMFMDLDNFKALNDKHGHSAGDLLLVEVASRLKACVREIDTVARFGGDEFVVLLDELALGQEESKLQAGVIAEKIRLALAETYVLSVERESADAVTLVHRCTASIGVTLFIHSEASQEDILMRADAAMYQAKEQGRDRVQFYASKAEAGADDVLVPG